VTQALNYRETNPVSKEIHCSLSSFVCKKFDTKTCNASSFAIHPQEYRSPKR